MTAADSNPGGVQINVDAPSAGNSDWRRISFTCRSAADGRRAIRALGEWSGRFELSEPEFQILWYLKSASGDGCDQTTIARQLACSPAQISATVERMRAEEWITQKNALGDRRRRLWQLSANGEKLLAQMLGAADQLRFPATLTDEYASLPDHGREAA
ncbi:MAG TPA: MarR family winged helix-turn-helix transcriptional regulator [Lacipirellulaceae bacterium]|nr:MarR family winged helix-turn-helix transcriptional regulator [Lacipirellulaceae bacterium]